MSYLPVTPKFGRRGNIDTIKVTPAPVIRFEAQRMSWRAVGGPHRANIRAVCSVNHVAELLDYLRNGVWLYDAQKTLCWWGYVHEVRARWGVSEIGISLDRMFNRVKVRYQVLSPGEDATEEAETDWAQNDVSVSEFGVKELILDAGDLVLALEGAEAMRDTRLAQVAFPSAVADYEGRATEQPIVDLLCRGWWDTLSWEHYNQDAGRISYTDTDGGGIQSIGQSGWTTGNTVMWEDASEGDFVYEVGGGFTRYTAGQIVTVTGATAANNNDTYSILEVFEGTGQRMTLDKDVDTDFTPDSVVFTPQGVTGAQGFLTGAADDWTVARMSIRVKKVGSPGDNLRVSIYDDDGSGNPNSSLVSGTIAGANLDGVMRWREFTPSTDFDLSPITEYHLVVDRTGADDPANTYHVELSSAADYGDGVFQYNNGLTWSTKSGFDMPFEIVGGYASSTLIKQTLEESDFVTEVTVVDNGRALALLTQIEEQTVKSVVEGLLTTGTSNDRRLLAKVDEHRAVTVYEEPAVTNGATLYRRDREGNLRDRYNVKIEPQRAGEIVGNWLESEDIRAIVSAGNDLTDAGRALIEEAEWTLSGNAVRLTARGAKNAWEL